MRAVSELILDHQIPWLGLDWPLDPETLFGRRAPLVVEVGFGDGEFLQHRAAAAPDHDHIGIEVSWPQILRLFTRIERESTTNVRVLRADAHLAFESLFREASIDEIIIHHPDPWPKERHHVRRLIQPDFVREVAQCLVPGGRVTIATDHGGYAEWIGNVLEGQSELASDLETTEVPVLPGRLATRYERKAREQGISNHFFVWKKVTDAAEPRPRRKVEDMPNVTFDGDFKLDDLFAEMKPAVHQERHKNVEVFINMVRIFRQTDEPHWMVETLVREGRLHQHVSVLALTHESGDRFTVKTSPIGFPRATYGIKRAVWHVARRLVEIEPLLKVVTSTVGNLR